MQQHENFAEEALTLPRRILAEEAQHQDGSGARVRTPSVNTDSSNDRASGGSHNQSRRASRQLFIENRELAVWESQFDFTSIICLTRMFQLGIVGLTTYFEVKTLYVLIVSFGQPCSQPLWLWLIVQVLFDFMYGCIYDMCCQNYACTGCKGLLVIAHTVWLIVGITWHGKAFQCARTSPELYFWVQVVILVSAFIVFSRAVLPLVVCLAVVVVVVLIQLELLVNRKRARDGTIDRIPVVEFKEDMFAESEEDDSRPQKECCCCTEEFDADNVIVVTPCNHYYHKECLEKWLKLAQTCPLCRNNLDEWAWQEDREVFSLQP